MPVPERERRWTDFLGLAARARDRRMFIAGYVAAIHDIERTGLQPFRDDTIRRSAESAWNLRGVH